MHIEFISTVAGAIDNPVLPIGKVFPEWFKNIPSEFAPPTAANLTKTGGTTYTIKGCTPVLDYITSGYLISSPDKIIFSAIEPTGDQVRSCTFYSNNPDAVKVHNHFQCPVDIENEKKLYIKFNPGWVVKTPPGYSCYFYQPEFFLENRFRLFPAIVDTDHYDFEPVQFPGYLLKDQKEFIVEPGTPLIAVFPFKRTNWTSTVSENPNYMKEEANASRIRRFNRMIYRKYIQVCHQTKKYK